MSHKDIDFETRQIVEGVIIHPNPPKYTDCCESNCGTEFSFFTGGGMQDACLVYGPIKIEKPTLVPDFDYQLEVWIWVKRTTQTHDEWWENHPAKKLTSREADIAWNERKI